MQAMASGPLSPYTVVDLTTMMSGPLATMLLADQGANIVKIESPDGDPGRRLGAGRSGTSAFFANLNRNKASIAIDLQDGRSRGVVRRLLPRADVFVQNLKVGAAERLGVGVEELRREFPQLIYVSITGFGALGPRALDPAYDHIVQAECGYAARQADPQDGVPELIRHGVIDKITAYTVAQAVTAALLHRTVTGVGEHVEISMVEAAINFLWPDGMCNHTLRDVPDGADLANSYRLTATHDGHIAFNVVTDRQVSGLIAAAGLGRAGATDAEERARFDAALMRQVRDRLSEATTDEVLERLRRHGVPCGAVAGLADLWTSPTVSATGVLEESEHPVLGRITQPRPAARMSSNPQVGRRPSPSLGEHTDRLLTAAGYTDAEIRALRDHRVVA